MAYESNLYKAVKNSGLATALGANALGAPILEPGPGATSDGVNIHRDYPWTLSKGKARDYVPKLMLTEYKLVLSSEVSGMLYTIRGEADNVNVIARQAVNNATNVAAAVGGTIALTHTGQTIAAGANAIGKLFSKIGQAEEKEKKQSGVPSTDATANNAAIQSAQSKDMTSSISGDGLDVYKGLYAVEPTKWHYVMPYLGTANMMTPNNQWGKSTQMRDAVSQAVGGLGQMANAAAPGVKGAPPPVASGPDRGSIDVFSMLKGAVDIAAAGRTAGLAVGGGLVASEEPQSFTGTGTDSIECGFYLYNTERLEDIRRNWEFCYLFTYQNLSNRKGINLLDPPCLYRALIPGYKQLPICWVSQLSIQNIGATKLIDIKTGEPASSSTDATNLKMIPEAYKVSFVLESALKNARNIFQFAADPSGVVTVSFSEA